MKSVRTDTARRKSNLISPSFKHGHKSRNNESSTYTSWRAMKSRCLNPKNPFYKYYGGRGIKICKTWLTFTGFLKDMGERPVNLTLERRNNNGNYEPGNCRWATLSEQAHNQRLRKDNKSGFKGLTWRANLKKWQVRVIFNKKLVYDKYFRNKIEAIRAREKFVKEFIPTLPSRT
jgi:hypothetical protein